MKRKKKERPGTAMILETSATMNTKSGTSESTTEERK
jgi:hypothetical protein